MQEVTVKPMTSPVETHLRSKQHVDAVAPSGDAEHAETEARIP